MSVSAASEAIHEARAAQHEWGSLSPSKRAHFLKRLRAQIADQRESIVAAIVQDTGKPALDALSGDVLVTLEHMRFYQKSARRILAPRWIQRSRFFFPGTSFRRYLEPHGVALIYGPANYPFQLAMVPAITALYAGNAVLLKASERTPATAAMMSQLFKESGFPQGIVQIVTDEPGNAGAYIDAGPDIVFFTGGSENGRAIAERAASHLTPSILELGGKDAALVFADCDIERTIEGITYGAFCNAGQVCVGTKRLYVEDSLYDEFVARLVQRVSRLRIGESHESDLGKLRGEWQRKRFREQIADALFRGACRETSFSDNDCGDTPVVLSNVPSEARLLCEESFGPVLCVSRFSSEAEAVALANSTPFALGASVWTRDRKRGRRVPAALQAGSCTVNDVIRNVGNPHAPFGGIRASGHGRYHGVEGLLAFSRTKTVMETHSRDLRERNWFPYTAKTYRQLSAIVGMRHNSLFSAIRKFFLFACVLTSANLFADARGAHAGHLRLTVHLPADAGGAVAYAVFHSPDGFPGNRDKAVIHAFSEKQPPGAVASIDAGSLPPGRYAVSVYLDTNGNRKLDTTFVGIPKEPVGASNNPKEGLGPPRFDDCTFQLNADGLTLDIRLVEPKFR